MGSFQFLGIVPLFIFMSKNGASYGMPEMPSGPTHLTLPIFAKHFLIMLILMVKSLSE